MSKVRTQSSTTRRGRRVAVAAGLLVVSILRLITVSVADASTPMGIQVSSSNTRSNPISLASSTISENAYIFVTDVPAGTKEVRFWVDDPHRRGVPVNVERVVPYDLMGSSSTGVALPLDTTTLADGRHSVSVLARTSSASAKLTAYFTVSNLSSSTTATVEPTTTTTSSSSTTTTESTTTTTAAPTTTTTTATEQTSTSSSTTGNKLRWAPPALTSPTVITVGPSGGSFSLATDKDYIVTIPQKVSAIGGVVLNGGRNVVLIGGHITIPWAGDSPSINARRALYLKGQTGVVHVEGLLIDNSGGDLSEGIQIAAPAATIQIQNVRITGIHARDEVGYTDNHPDLIQPWGGAAALRIDRFSGSTDYQAFMLKADYNGPLGPVQVSNVNVWPTQSSLSRYMLWQGPDSVTYPLNYDNVWLTTASGRSLGKSVWPDTSSSNLDKRAILSADGLSVTWPTASQITGVVRSGVPAGGDFVPEGLAGLAYVSPGYL